MSPRLVALHQALPTAGVPPSRRIAQLRRLVSWLDSTHNLMFAPIAFVLLVRQQLAIAIDRWHATNGAAAGNPRRPLVAFNAQFPVATLSYDRPDDAFPRKAEPGPPYPT